MLKDFKVPKGTIVLTTTLQQLYAVS